MAKIATLERLKVEVAELELACRIGVRAEILDEFVDVQFFLDRLAVLYDLTDRSRASYMAAKGLLRETTGKNKKLELKLAELFLDLTNEGGSHE